MNQTRPPQNNLLQIQFDGVTIQKNNRASLGITVIGLPTELLDERVCCLLICVRVAAEIALRERREIQHYVAVHYFLLETLPTHGHVEQGSPASRQSQPAGASRSASIRSPALIHSLPIPSVDADFCGADANSFSSQRIHLTYLL